MDAWVLWCRLRIVDSGGRPVATHELTGPGVPDLHIVGRIARLALRAKRAGGWVELSAPAPGLCELLALAGSRVDVQGKVEFGEEPFGVDQRQEELHPTDGPV